MLRSIVKLLCVTLSVAMLTGCSVSSFSVDGLLTAPKLMEEQSEIHQALIASVGDNITLKYPRNGDNRSAYVVANIDDEAGDEALVFYEYINNVNGDDGIRLNLLDKDENGEWQSVKELAGAGTDIDRVVISAIGKSGETDILVGYQTLGSDLKTLEIYKYADSDFSRMGTDYYSLLETADINADGYNELITINQTVDADSGYTTAQASLLKIDGNEIVRENTISMCDGVTSYANSVVGKLSDNSKTIYVDGINSSGNLQTELIYYKYSSLQNPVAQRQTKLLPASTRPIGYLSNDIDGDEVVEIPVTKVLSGYENTADEEKLYLTTWYTYQDFYKLEAKYSGYYSLSDGYFCSFPSRWSDQVTVKIDLITNEVVFYAYSGADLQSSTTELMRIAVVARADSESYSDDGYDYIDSVGQLDYMVKLPADKREQLILTLDEVKNGFYIIN